MFITNQTEAAGPHPPGKPGAGGALVDAAGLGYRANVGTFAVAGGAHVKKGEQLVILCGPSPQCSD